MQNKVHNVHEELSLLQSWSLSDQLELLEGLVAMIRQRESKKTRRSILEFEGMDKESWKDVNVEEYLNQVATAICREAEFFLTNYKRLPDIPDINMLMFDELKKS
jgi:hypothetical protein